jgi:predicted ArsR family transcriptional regulator
MMNHRKLARDASRALSTQRAILQILKQEGPKDAVALGAQLGVSPMAVRLHLYALRRDHVVTYEQEARPVGRPAKMWRLTPAATGLFPDGHAALALDLLRATAQSLGAEGLRAVIAQCARRQIEAYRRRVPRTGSLRRRLKALVSLRNEDGYMAEIQPQRGGSFLLIQNHCPICAAATGCTNLCGRELEVFEGILGRTGRVERLEHIMAGARRCVYRIRPS